MKILALNAGSSSLKAALYVIERAADGSVDAGEPRWTGHADWNHSRGEAAVRTHSAAGSHEWNVPAASLGDAVVPMIEALWSGPEALSGGTGDIDAVGHRIVHGGPYRESVLLTPDVRHAIANFSDLAPEHNRVGLEGVAAIDRVLGGVPQVAVFDTSFHTTLAEEAYVYPGPYAWLERGIRRYGFHGISHGDASARAARLLGRDAEDLRVVTCHLGSGCSLAAVRDGKCIDTTMGFTPLEGVMMGTRSGSVDPGILIYLLRHAGHSADDLDRVLNRESGLLGISGISSDMREVLAARERGEKRARLAFDVFVHRVRSEIGAMMASLGGLDVLVFTAGIGENSPEVRSAVCQGWGFLGLALDEEANTRPGFEGEISAQGSRVRVVVIHAEEERAIARETLQVVTGRL